MVLRAKDYFADTVIANDSIYKSVININNIQLQC